MMTFKRPFNKLDVTVTLTGKEWLAVLVRFRFGDQGSSPECLEFCNDALDKIQSQVLDESEANLRERIAVTDSGVEFNKPLEGIIPPKGDEQ